MALGVFLCLAGGALAIETGLLGLRLGLLGGAGSRLGLTAGALGGLGGATRLARTAEVALDGALEPRPGSGLLLLLPESDEAVAEQLAPGLEVDGQHVESAVGGPVRSLGSQPRVEVRSHARPGPDRAGIASLQILEVRAHSGQHHVAVVDLTEDVLEVASAAARGVGRTAEAEAG